MKNVKKYIIVSAVTAVLMIVFAVLMIMYDKGAFDISFIKRDEQTTSAKTETEPETETDTETQTPDTTDQSGETDEGEETADPSVFEAIHEAIPATNGKTVIPTEKTYDGKTTFLYRLDTLTLPTESTMGDSMLRTRYSLKLNGVQRIFTEMKQREVRRAADVYMGMIVVSDGKSLTFYDGTGMILMKYSGEKELVFAYERDSEDRPLFILDDEYYYIDSGAKILVKSDFTKKQSRGLYYNYPSTFGKNAEKANFRYSYYPVEQKDEGGIGSVYFDSGYVMVRNIKHERDDTNKKVVEDMEIIVDEDGKEFKLPEGCKAKAYSDQRILVEYSGKYGFYAIKGAWITDTVYTYATPYYEGLAVVGTFTQKGVIDMDGNFVIPTSYSYISVCSGGIIVCWSSQTGYDIYIKTEK